MLAFFVGLAVVVVMAAVSFAGVFLLPLLFVVGFSLKFFLGVLLTLFTIWLIGKLTLLLIDAIKKRPSKG